MNISKGQLKGLNDNRNSSYKQQIAYDRLKEAIITCELPPEAMLVERNLCEHMSLSRTPIRAALKQLEVEGYVTSVPGRGVFVSTLHYEDFIEIYELKEALESMAASLCSLRKTDTVISDLEKYCFAYQQAVEEKKYELTQEFDIKFHRTFIHGARNKRLEKSLESVLEQTRRVMYTQKENIPPYEYETLADQHGAILNGIRSGDPELARKAAAEHVENVKTFYKVNVFKI